MEIRNKIFAGHWKDIAKGLPPGCFDMIVTSPPYYGLRDYGTATWEGGDASCDHVANPSKTKKQGNPEFNENRPSREETLMSGYFADVCPKCGAVRIDQQEGQQETPEDFIKSLVEGFRLLRPALKDWGTLWVNIGDSYAAGPAQREQEKNYNNSSLNGSTKRQKTGLIQKNKITGDLKAKDLIGIPWMLAFALRADGWYLRQDIIWNKPNPMPESVRDRCTKSHEYIFLLSKSSKYYFDAEAIKEDATNRAPGNKKHKYSDQHRLTKHLGDISAATTRNRRSVWTVTTKPFKDAHFACYPPDLIQPCIKAGTSEKGNCKNCGKPWERIVESTNFKRNELSPDDPRYRPNNYAGAYEDINGKGDAGYTETKTVGWQKTCKCETDQVVPAIVYDPFMGSGTTASASILLGRHYSGSELNAQYINIKDKRLHKELGLFNQ